MSMERCWMIPPPGALLKARHLTHPANGVPDTQLGRSLWHIHQCVCVHCAHASARMSNLETRALTPLLPSSQPKGVFVKSFSFLSDVTMDEYRESFNVGEQRRSGLQGECAALWEERHIVLLYTDLQREHTGSKTWEYFIPIMSLIWGPIEDYYAFIGVTSNSAYVNEHSAACGLEDVQTRCVSLEAAGFLQTWPGWFIAARPLGYCWYCLTPWRLQNHGNPRYKDIYPSWPCTALLTKIKLASAVCKTVLKIWSDCIYLLLTPFPIIVVIIVFHFIISACSRLPFLCMCIWSARGPRVH